MTETLPRLLVLQACDQRIQQMIHTLDTLQQSLAAVKEENQVKVQAVRAWQEKITESEKARDHLTLQIKQVKGQLRGKRCVLHRSRAGQPEETVQREIAFLEASKAALEEELRTVVTQIAQDSAALRQAEDLIPIQHCERQRTASSLLSQVAATAEELRKAQDERTALATEIAPLLLQEYERIFSRRGEVAVVALANETCQGCSMHLPPQMCVELQRHPRLTFCPHCHRILFVPIETSLPVVEPCSAANSANGHRTPQPQRRPKTRTRTSKKPLAAELPPASPAQV